jgi:hypothetical protein
MKQNKNSLKKRIFFPATLFSSSCRTSKIDTKIEEKKFSKINKRFFTTQKNCRKCQEAETYCGKIMTFEEKGLTPSFL